MGCDRFHNISILSYSKISTHTSRVGCDDLQFVNSDYSIISTHTSRVGCDDIDIIILYTRNISTHTSRVGCDGIPYEGLIYEKRFLLTHPVWDVTKFEMKTRATAPFLLTHPVWDVTCSLGSIPAPAPISTHTSRVGCDGYLSPYFLII